MVNLKKGDYSGITHSVYYSQFIKIYASSKQLQFRTAMFSGCNSGKAASPKIKFGIAGALVNHLKSNNAEFKFDTLEYNM